MQAENVKDTTAAIPAPTKAGVSLLLAVTVILYSLALWRGNWQVDRHDLVVAAILFAFLVLAEAYDISFPHTAGTFHVSVGSPIALASGLTLGPLVGGSVVIAAILVESVAARRTPIKAIVNIATLGLVTFVSGAVYDLFADPEQSPLSTIPNMAAVVAASFVFILINLAVLSAIVAPVVGTTPARMLQTNLAGIYVQAVTLPTLGAIVPVLADQNPIALLVLVIPLIGPLLAFKGFENARRETQALMERLADILERRDPSTFQHSQRVTGYVAAMLQELPPLPYETTQGLLAAARVHDIGKVAIRDQALMKAGPLTPDEWAEIEQHASIGADIVEGLWVYRPWATVIRHHHERWDGRGYPAGLAGDAIPLGARIIAVADAYDAMTSDRVYRPALDQETALAELRKGSGTQFDPEVVAAFERALRAPAAASVATRCSSTVAIP